MVRMAELPDAHALAIERSCAVTAVALSEQRREGVRLVTGDKRGFGLNAHLTSFTFRIRRSRGTGPAGP